MANWRLEPLLHDLPRLTTALVLIAAENDRSIPPGDGRRVREICSHAVIERVRGLGHLAHEEQPQLIADVITRCATQTKDAGSNAPAM
jgi:magnesium chelatase accessory protein